MNKPESELSRQARLVEQRQQRRGVLTTITVAISASLLIGGFAFARLQTDRKPTVEVSGVSSVSSTSSPKFVAPIIPTTQFVDPTTTTIKRVTPAASTSTSSAATTTTFPPIPPNLGDLFTTTTAPPTTTTAVVPTIAPTAPTVPVAPNIVWTTSPNPLQLQSGAQGTFTVTARNIGNGAGQVGCPPMPNGVVCTQQQFTLAPNQSKSWSGVVWATTGGSRLGKSLTPGNHQIFIGVAVLRLRVTA